MDKIGAEVGQKMRSAIKAKLMELHCYVDDELPDYIMVMVANKRSKSQMNEDLQLFLTSKTSAFVDWLHIVLKKLKEVTVTNPEVYKKVSKRKSDDSTSSVKVKKEKKDKKNKKLQRESEKALQKESEKALQKESEKALQKGTEKALQKESEKELEKQSSKSSQEKSLTDDLPFNVGKASEQRKVVIMKENEESQARGDSFDIPPLSEVSGEPSEKELQEIKKKIRNVKSRLGLLVESDSNDEEYLNIKAEPDDLFTDKKEEKKKNVSSENDFQEPESTTPPRRYSPLRFDTQKITREKITFSQEESTTPPKKKSILDRLGKRQNSDDDHREQECVAKKSKISLSEILEEENRYLKRALDRDDIRTSSWKKRKEDSKSGVFSRISDPVTRKEKQKESILNRLGVQSKVSVPPKEDEDPLKTREVPSVVKIKPRIIPPDTPQANKNLLLKAVADAQRSIAQTPPVGSNFKSDVLYTKKYRELQKEDKSSTRRLSELQKNKIKNIIVQVAKHDKYSSPSDDETEYVPKPIRKPPQTNLNYTPTSKADNISLEELSDCKEHQFIVTLDGIDKMNVGKTAVKLRLENRKSPSPIIFNKVNTKVKKKINVPDKLPVIQASPSLKNKERCKYWPNCRQGDKCEFVHPSTNCEQFPKCKFGEKCLYIHPSCKFSSSCTRRDCPYSHAQTSKVVASRVVPSTAPLKLTSQSLQTCKFFPNCTNVKCSFYHPKPCKYGKYCMNQGECNFLHTFSHTKSSLTWRSK